MNYLKGFPPSAFESIKMLAVYTRAYVILSTGTGSNLESLIAAAEKDLPAVGKENLLKTIKTVLPLNEDNAGWQKLSDKDMAAGFKAARYAIVDSGPLVKPTYLWLFTHEPCDWSKHCLLLMEQTRHALENQYSRSFYESKFSEDKGGRDKFRLLFEFSPVGIFFYNTSMQITAFNSRFTKILQADPQQLLELNLKDIEDKKIFPALQAPLKGEEGYYEGAYNSTLSQITIEIFLKTAPVFDEHNNVTGVIGVVQDNTERIKTINALNESEERLRLLINTTPDIIVFKDNEGRWIIANEACQQLYRVKGKQFIGSNREDLQELVPELKEVFQDCERSDQVAWDKRHLVRVEEIVPLRDGTSAVLEVVKVPVFYPDGSRRALVVQGRDITRRKRFEELLRESEERFRLVAMNTNDIIYEWEISSGKLLWHGDFKAVTGEAKNPSLFDELVEMIHPDDRDKVSKAWEENFKLKKPWREEFRVLLSNGEACYFRGSGIVLFNHQKPVKAFGTLTNVTKEHELIQHLQEAIEEGRKSNARISGLLSAIPDVIVMFDNEGFIRDYHASDEQKLYVPPEKFINRPVEEVLPPDVAALTREKINRVMISKGIEIYDYSLLVDGKKIDYEGRMVYLHNDHLLVIIRDVSRARAAEKELIEARDKAQESDRLKTAFVANMSHEIRTPMNSILGFAELLTTPGLSNQEQSEFTDLIQRSGQQLLRIINDVLEISQLETGMVELTFKRVNLCRIMDDVSRLFTLDAGRKDIELKTQIPEHPVFVKADGPKLNQVITNLLHNAIKFTPHGGIVSAGFEETDDEILFFVKDAGIGIAPEHHTKIFDRFMQVSKSDFGGMGGTGLGLPICKNLLELMKGRIWFESEPGRGTSFFFTISRSLSEDLTIS